MSGISEQEQRALAHSMRLLSEGRTDVGVLEDYLIGFAIIGRVLADAEAEAEHAEIRRKSESAKAFAAAKHDGATDRLADAEAENAVETFRFKEIEARRRATELRNIRESIREMVWAIKFMGRQDGSSQYGG